MDAPISSYQVDISKYENKMFLLVSTLYHSNEEKIDKVRKLFDEFVFSDKPNLDEISLQSQEHKKALIEMRHIYINNLFKLQFKNMCVDKLRFYDERQKFYEETQVTVNPSTALSLEEISRKLSSVKMDNFFNSEKDRKEPVEEIERIERIDLNKDPQSKEKERIAPPHELDDEALARQLSLELNGEVVAISDEAYARKLQKEMDSVDRNLFLPSLSRYEPGIGYQQPVPRRSGFAEFHEGGNLGHYYPSLRRRAPTEPEDGIPEPFFTDFAQPPKDILVNHESPRFIWLSPKDKVFIESGTKDKVVKCYRHNSISINENCLGITVSQATKSKIHIIGSQVILKGAVECDVTIKRRSKVVFEDSKLNNVVASRDSEIINHEAIHLLALED